MRVYLDNCCYNRPFDDQGQLKIRLETEAKLAVQQLMREGAIEYVWSEMLDSEALDSPHEDRRAKVLRWRVNAADYVETDEDLLVRAENIMEYGVKSSDAVHLAEYPPTAGRPAGAAMGGAERADCDWFLTVDRGILKKRIDGSTRVANPLDYVREEL